MKIEILNSITHDGVVFGRGIYEVGRGDQRGSGQDFRRACMRAASDKGYAAQAIQSASIKGVAFPSR